MQLSCYLGINLFFIFKTVVDGIRKKVCVIKDPLLKTSKNQSWGLFYLRIAQWNKIKDS